MFIIGQSVCLPDFAAFVLIDHVFENDVLFPNRATVCQSGRIVTSLVRMLSLAKFINLPVNVLQATSVVSLFKQFQSWDKKF